MSSSASSPSWFQVAISEKFGRYLQAACDIPAGTLIVKEPPAFYGPSADYVEDYNTPVCLGCAVVMNDGNEGNRCPTCSWPLCSEECDNISYHREYECELFAKEKVPFPPTAAEHLPIQNCYKGLTILRGILLRERDPDMWDKVMNLQYENEIKDEDIDFDEFKASFGLPNFSPNEDWQRILGVLNVNSYSIQRIEKKIGSPSFAEFIYPYQCLMNHSCVPNCNWAISYSPTFIVHVKASVDIKKGEMLTVAYNYELISKYGSPERQGRIRLQAKFNCKCPRCLDPTDFGSFSGGVVCFKCKERVSHDEEAGIMLPVTTTDPEADWKCNLCDYKMCPSFLSSFQESLVEQIEMIEKESEEMETDEIVESLEDFISHNRGTILHPNHWILTLAEQNLINHQIPRLSELSEEDLENLLKHLEHILGIRDLTIPGFSTEKGVLQHQIARVRFYQLQKRNIPTEKGEEEVKALYALQQKVLSFWEGNTHYGTLLSNYKQDAEVLKQEMNELKLKYPFLS